MPRQEQPQAHDEHDALYSAMLAHDARFDGHFFVGVTSTGVYCRPVCRVRTPLRRHCRFFANAPSAETAGFRPCLRCRPELAPGLSLVDSSAVLAAHAARMLDQQVADGNALRMGDVAARLGVTDRHFRRVFLAAHGVSPVDYVTTRRLLLAKQLLTDTTQSVTDIALASGFGSLRRFHAAFAERYRLSPTDLRKRGAPAQSEATAKPLRLGYRPPYDTAGVLRFFSARAVKSMEEVQGLTIRRTWTVAHAGATLSGWVSMTFQPEKNEVLVRVSPTLLPATAAVLQGVRHALDLDADPQAMEATLARLPCAPLPGLRLCSGIDGFEAAVRIVLGQQVTVAGANTLTSRLVQALGEPLATPFEGLTHLFPSAHALAEASSETIGQLGIVRQRVRALQGLARAVQSGELQLHRAAALEPTLAALRELPGVGEWTAQLVAMRCLGWADAFPSTDIALLNALGTRDIKSVEHMAEAWRPWRAYAVMRLWQTLEK